jgi:hypothetical protein
MPPASRPLAVEGNTSTIEACAESVQIQCPPSNVRFGKTKLKVVVLGASDEAQTAPTGWKLTKSRLLSAASLAHQGPGSASASSG